MIERNKSIDGLRGICAVFIVIFHLIVRYHTLYMDSTIPNVLLINHWGEIFSVVFLIISAFFLYKPHDAKRDDEFDIFAYYKGKITRLWPTYFISITITFVVTRFIVLPGRTGDIKDYLLNVTLLNGYINTPYIDGAHWYITTLVSAIVIMGVIKKFKAEDRVLSYLLWGAVFIAIKILSKLTGDAIASVLLVFERLLGSTYIGVLCVGIGFHKIFYDVKERKNSSWEGILITCIGLIISVFTLGIWRILGILLGLVMIICCICFPKSILSSKPLIFLGEISYPVYLIHQNIGFIIQNTLRDLTGYYSIWYAFIAGVVVIVLGILLWRIDAVMRNAIKIASLK